MGGRGRRKGEERGKATHDEREDDLGVKRLSVSEVGEVGGFESAATEDGRGSAREARRGRDRTDNSSAFRPFRPAANSTPALVQVPVKHQGEGKSVKQEGGM